MYCLKCGKEIDNTATTCPFCGCVTENAQFDDQLSLEQNNANESINTLAKASLIVGIVGIVFAWLFALIGYIISAVALALALVARSKNKSNPKSKNALIVSIVSFACCIISSIIGIIMMS